MDKNNIYDHHLMRDGQKLKKVYLNYPPDGTILRCDCCDEDEELASITMLCSDVACICKDCLMDIVNEFDPDDDTKWQQHIKKWREK